MNHPCDFFALISATNNVNHLKLMGDLHCLSSSLIRFDDWLNRIVASEDVNTIRAIVDEIESKSDDILRIADDISTLKIDKDSLLIDPFFHYYQHSLEISEVCDNIYSKWKNIKKGPKKQALKRRYVCIVLKVVGKNLLKLRTAICLYDSYCAFQNRTVEEQDSLPKNRPYYIIARQTEDSRDIIKDASYSEVLQGAIDMFKRHEIEYYPSQTSHFYELKEKLSLHKIATNKELIKDLVVKAVISNSFEVTKKGKVYKIQGDELNYGSNKYKLVIDKTKKKIKLRKPIIRGDLCNRGE